ncbi:hypothetical protein [Armatimonas sp.]|uniref:hypothetical protein n=1 Tax=Armatimonas sp. TaxID=1872638 RepID=UPI003753DAF3
MNLLTTEQRAAFNQDGFLLVPGLIPGDVAAKAEAAIWEKLEANPTGPSTWEGKPVGSGHSSPEVLAIFSAKMAQLVEELSEEAAPDWQPPRSAFALNIFPQPGEWSHYGPHIDHALERDNFIVFPRPMRLASLLYLTDCKRDGAPTVSGPARTRRSRRLPQAIPSVSGSWHL